MFDRLPDPPADRASNPPQNISVVLLTAPPAGFGNDNAAMIKIDGRESVLRCMEMYANRPGVVQIILVVTAADAEETKRKIGSHLMFMGVKLVQGRAGWTQQLADAHQVIRPETEHVITHDAARPAVPFSDLDRLINMAGQYPAVALGRSVKGVLASSKIIPGPAEISSFAVAEVLSPALYTRATFDTLASGEMLPNSLQLIEGSPLNVRCGWNDAKFVTAMVALLPKPKAKAPTSPFEEAQW